MKIVQTSDYLIYFDSVRVDPYILNWSTMNGLSAGEAAGSITMFKSRALMDWKAYLTQVRVFAKNIFTGKYTMVFEGEITDRSWDDMRANSGTIQYQFQGFFHWLDIPIPMMINSTETFDQLQNFMYEAQGINYNAVAGLFKNQEELSLKNKSIEEVVLYLFDKMHQGYYAASQDNSSFAFADVRGRFKVMADIVKEYRAGGFLDIFTLQSSTQIQTFYVYLNQILGQMMMEFYQDRDGTLRIKNPSWSDDVLKNHIIDESVIQKISGVDRWSSEPTRVLAIGGSTDLYQQAQQSGTTIDPLRIAAIPVGLYIGDAQKGHPEDYYSATLENLRQKYGLNNNDLATLSGTLSTAQWFDNLTGNYTITSPFTGTQARTDVAGNTAPHRGVDFGLSQGTLLRNIGTTGTVLSKGNQESGGGNILVIEESIGGKTYQFKYMHLSEFLVTEGQSVSPGEPIAKSGGTRGTPGAGNATGPHLHFEIWDMAQGAPIDPAAFLQEMRAQIQRQADQAASSTAPDSSQGGVAAFNRLMGRITPYANVIAQAASQAGVDAALAKVFIAVTYDQDNRRAAQKGLDYNDVDVVASMLTPIAGLKVADIQGIQNNLAYLGDATVRLLVDGAQRMSVVASSSQTAAAGNTQGTAYNAFATTDNSYQKNAFPNLFTTDFTKNFQTQASGVSAQSDWMTITATAYIATCPGCTGITRTGLDVRDTSKDYRVIAVDPAVIPLYSLVEIQGSGGVSGTYQALDTGGAIKGARIDILMSTYSKAMDFGRREVKLRILRRGKGGSDDQLQLRAVTFASSNQLVYPVPPAGEEFRQAILNNQGHVDPNMISAMIDVASSWRAKFQNTSGGGETYLGLMGIPKSYADAVDAAGSPVDWFDGNRSIELGSKFFAHCLDVLHNKPTLALAAYYVADPTVISNIANNVVKAFDYVKMRDEIAKLGPGVTAFVESVVDVHLTSLKGDYISGDPHKDFGRVYVGGSYVDRITATNATPDGFDNAFAIKLSDEELRFKMKLQIAEQRLIRYDSAVAAGSSKALIDKLIKQYAKYMMQVSRASTHSIGVDAAVCLPFLRPGFNVWLEPSRSNVVAYVTGVTHQGAWARGCFTSIRGEFVRTPSNYNQIDELIFLGERHVRSSDFGSVVKQSDMTAMRQKLIDMHRSASEIVDDAHNITVLQDLYQAGTVSGSAAQYVTEWNSEYTRDEIDSKIKEKYAAAPSIVQQRVTELKTVISESEDFFMNKLLATLS